MATLSQATSASSEVFDSRKSRRVKGIGYPSCNTELALIPPNTKDPHGYYAEIGVPPSATEAEIRTAIRLLYRRYHPDTGDDPDPDKLQRIKLIGEVLLDPIERDKYNRTPPGMRKMDAVYAAELSKIDELNTLDVDELAEIMQPRSANPYQGNGTRFDYFAINHDLYYDDLRAQMWYHHFIAVAPMVNYRRVIKVLLHDGPANYDSATGVMSVPRKWEPTSAMAFSLFTHVAGFRVGSDGESNTPLLVLPFAPESQSCSVPA